MAEKVEAEVIEEVSEEQINSSLKEKRYLRPKEMISYCLVALSQRNIDEFVNSFRQKFAIDNLGLDPTVYANIQLGASIYDALDDTISGLVIDRTRTRWGRIKPYLILPIPLLAIGLYMLFNIPSLGAMGTTVYYIAATVLYGLGMSYFGAWYLIMYNDTPNIKERNTLITVSEFAKNFGAWATSLLALPLDFMPKLGVSQNSVYKYFSLFCVIICTCACLFGFKNMRERIPLASREEMNEVGFVESFKQLLKNPQMFIYILANFFNSFKSVGSANEKFFWAHCTGKMSFSTLVSLFTGLPNFVMAPIAGKWVNKFGAKKTIVAAALFGGAAYTTMWLVGYHPFSAVFDDKVALNLIWIGFALTVCGLPNKVISVCLASLLGDVFDYSEWKNGIRNEALVSTISGYFGKLGNSINQWLSAMVLTWIGYEAARDAAEAIGGVGARVTDAHVQSGLWLIFAMAPAAARFLTGIAFMFFKIDGEFKVKMLADLKERRQAAIDELETKEAALEEENTGSAE